MRYRPEIDGLRAVAVLPVILFHANFSIFGGGFVGVDVFFVISGYLITSILITELEQGNFSIGRFYERRARRILPALFVVMAACLPFAVLWMPPPQLKDFAQSLVAVVFFVSNVLFQREEGYFAAAAELKPLLHTWSLAVEEQYYVLFPVVLLVLWRFGRQRVFWSVVVVAAASLLLSEWGWRNKPSANFFLAPTRAWELLAGSICAFLSVGRPQRSANLPSALGLAMVVFAILAYDEATPFPSLYALVPVAGTALIILFAARDTWAARLLSQPAWVGIGLISYSAYLWHQPLFAFARLRSLTEPSEALMAALAVASLGLAWATWAWVERPFRRGGSPLLASRRSVFLASGVAGAVLVAIGAVGHLTGGLERRYSDDVLRVIDVRAGDSSGCHNGLDAAEVRRGEECRIGSTARPVSVAILGDSHAAAISDAVGERLADHDLAAAAFNGSWCVPLVDLRTDDTMKGGCVDFMRAAFDQATSRDGIEVVVLHAEWAAYVHGYRWPERHAAAYRYAPPGAPDQDRAEVSDNARSFEAALDHALASLGRSGKKIVIVLPVPEPEVDVPLVAVRAAARGGDANDIAMDLSRYRERTSGVRDLLVAYGEKHGAMIVDPEPVFCPDARCRIVDEAGHALYIDGNHLSYRGGRLLAPAIVDGIRKALSGPA